MVARTRYFVIASLLVLGVGLGSGLVAYYVGFPAGAFQRTGGPAELQYIPRTATVVAYADVRDIMSSELRQKLHQVIPAPSSGHHEFEERTGINIETDIDRVVASYNHDGAAANSPGNGLVIARGRFNEVKIEALMRGHGAQAEEYRGKRLISAAASGNGGTRHAFAAAFLEPGLVALGSTAMVRSAIELHQTGDNPQAGLQSVTGNEELMNMVRSLDSGNAWAVGRFDTLQSQARLPQEIAGRIPPITWFAVSGQINGGLRGLIRAETRDEESANNLRDVVRGFMALGKLQAGSRPEVQAMMQSLELGGTGKTVALSFTVPAEIFDAVAAFAPKKPQVQ